MHRNWFSPKTSHTKAHHSRSFGFGNKLVRPSDMQHVIYSNHPNNVGQSINISNLARSVSDSDITELFGEFGQICKAAVHYDAQGCHLGSATVTFAQATAAKNAMLKYNGVSLDKSPMRIQLNQTGASMSLSQRLSFSNNSGIGQCSNPEPNNVYRYRNEGNNDLSNTSLTLKGRKMNNNLQNCTKRNRDDTPDPEKLDDELEEYMKMSQKKKKTPSISNEELTGVKKKKHKKERKIKSTIKSEDTASSLTSDSNDQLYQQELDNELDLEIERRFASPGNQPIKTEQEAVKIQEKLMSLI